MIFLFINFSFFNSIKYKVKFTFFFFIPNNNLFLNSSVEKTKSSNLNLSIKLLKKYNIGKIYNRGVKKGDNKGCYCGIKWIGGDIEEEEESEEESSDD